MSLDVYLSKDTLCPHCNEVLEPGIFVYSSNITHNLTTMADKAGIYKHLWRPEELGLTHAKQLIKGLTKGLKKLEDNPKYYKTFNSPNGWGLYKNFVPFVEKYLNACKEYPEAIISISR